MTHPRGYTLEVSGRMACFTRPEMKVERVSYEVITPSAARAIFEAIYWKPQIRWRVVKIEVLNPIAFTHVRRCEVTSMVSTKKEHIIAENHRQLRSSLVLRDVAYRLTAQMEVLPTLSNIEVDNTPEKHFAIFERRASRGQCFTQPYLGCREFAADWRLVDENESAAPIAESKDLGMMLYDMDFSNPENPTPKFFRALMNNGTINLPVL